jgi:hypothetical protein
MPHRTDAPRDERARYQRSDMQRQLDAFLDEIE